MNIKFIHNSNMWEKIPCLLLGIFFNVSLGSLKGAMLFILYRKSGYAGIVIQGRRDSVILILQSSQTEIAE